MLNLIQGDSVNYLMLKNGSAKLRKNVNKVLYPFLKEWSDVEIKNKIEKNGIW